MLKSKNKSLYWQKLLSDFTSPSILGINKSILTQVSSPHYLENDIRLSIELQRKIHQYSHTHQVGMVAFLQGAWGYLLARYSGNNDVVFGANLMSKKSVSDSLNIIPVRIQYHPSETVFTYLKRFQQQLIESQQYSQITLNEIQNLSDMPASSSLFNHIFIYTKQPRAYKPTYPLNIIVTDNDRLSIKIIFDENQYSQITIENLISHYHELLKSMITSPEKALIDLTFMTSEEMKKIVIDWNKTDEDFPQGKTICQLFEEQAEKTPDNVAIVYKDQHLTYREFNQKINQLANYLQSLDVKPDMMIAISMERSLDLLISIYGILKAGAAYVPLDPTQPENRLTYMLEDCKAPFLITTSDLQNKFSHYQGKFILMDKDANKMKNDTQNSVVAKPSNLAYVIYTSGSTGNPKGVMIEHRSLFNFLYSSQIKFPLHQHDAYLFKTNQTFDLSIAEIFGWFFDGGKLVILEQGKEKEGKEVLATITKHRVTHTYFVPSLLQMMLDSTSISDMKSLESLKYLLVIGEAISKKLVYQIKELLEDRVHFINAYGPTETTVAVSEFNLKNNFDSVNTPIGKPLHNTKLYILDKHLHIVPTGVPGELHIGGIGLARGYLNRAELTAKKFIQNPFSDDPDSKLYKSGDLCRYLPNGNIEYIGRIDHQVKIRGYRIELGEIEACLHAHPDIKTVIVVVNEDQKGEKQLIAYYTLKSPNLKLSTHELHQYSQEKLPIYMVPAAFVEMKKFPLTHTGKIDRKALPKPTISVSKDYIAPTTPFEKTIADIWENEFKVKVSIRDNFFDLGGHSLSAARIIYKIKKATHKEIPLSEFYASPTIEKLSASLNHIKNTKEVEIIANQIKSVDPYTGIPMTEMQFFYWITSKAYAKLPGVNVVESKRIYGKLDIEALKYSLTCVFKKHEILSYHISKYFPFQYQQKNFEFTINERDISSLSTVKQNDELAKSLEELIKFYSWKKGFALLVIRLFYLGDAMSELQICLPHTISDEVSMDILLSDLSKYYLTYKEKREETSINPTQYKDFIVHELNSVNITLNRDISFWEEYFNNVTTFSLPSAAIENNNTLSSSTDSYVTCIKFPESLVNQLIAFCGKHRISISDCLCASTALALSQYRETEERSKSLALFLIRSGRDNEIYDHTIGPFLRTNLFKIDIKDTSNLISLAKSIKQSKIETETYQFCPTIIKYASFKKSYWRQKPILNAILIVLTKIVSKLFPKLHINDQFLLSFFRFAVVPLPKQYLIAYINITNSFIKEPSDTNQKLFGFESANSKENPNNFFISNDALEINFSSKQKGENVLYIIGKITTFYREKIASEIINQLSHLVG